MSEIYSIGVDINAGNNLAVINQLIESIQRVETVIGQVSAKPLRVTADKPNLANFFAACDQAEAKVIKVKSQIEGPSTISGGFSNFLNAEKGKFANVGREMGQSLQMGMQQFGMAGGMASSVAGAFGAVGIAAAAGAVGVGVLAAASTKAAMAWEDMKTSIGRTTNLGGAQLEDLMSQLQDLRQEYGITREAASAMVEQAGSIGVGQKKMEAGDLAGYKQEILEFTKATSILQGAWGMSAEATSQGIGKMGSVTLGQWNIQKKARGEEEMSWAEYAYKVGGITDNLANAMGSSEEEIVTAMKNSSAAVAKWAPDEATYGKWQAMASFLIDTGASAGEAGTQIERVAQKMEQNGTDAAKILGLDQAGLNVKLKSDFMGTIQELGKAVATMPEGSRPDLFKMFGLEGAAMIGKVVADIEAGTGKLQAAFDLAAKPGNVAKGYEEVANNASKQFARIGEAFQVSLEKIGGQLLPMVTYIAGGIADAWIKGNELGTKAFEGYLNSEKVMLAGGSLSDAASVLFGGEVSEENLKKIEKFEKRQSEIEKQAAAEAEVRARFEAARQQAEYQKTTQYGVGQKALAGESFFGASFKDLGTKSGIGYIDALNSELNTALPKTFTDNYLKVYDVAGQVAKRGGELSGAEWQAGFNEKVKAGVNPVVAAMMIGGGVTTTGKTISGMSEIDALTMAAMQSAETKANFADPRLTNRQSTFFGDYAVQELASNYRSGGGGIAQLIDSTGKALKSANFKYGDYEQVAKELEDSIKPVFLDMPKWLSQKGDALKSTLSGIISDGVVEGFEKDQLTETIKKLDDLRVRVGADFDKAGLDQILRDYEKTELGIKVKLDAGELETNFALWQRDNMDNYQKIFDTLSPLYGKTSSKAMPYEPEEKQLHTMLRDANSDRLTFLYSQIDKALSSGNIEDAEVLGEVITEIGGIEPDILKLESTTKRLDAIETIYGISVKATASGFTVLDSNGKVLSSSHLRTSVSGNLAADGLTRAAEAAYAFATAANTFASTPARAGILSSGNNAWAQSRISDAKYAATGNLGLSAFAARPDSAFPGLSFSTTKMGFKLPGLKGGGKVPAGRGGLVEIGEGGETEYVITESQLEGLYPKFAKAEKGSMQYLTGERMFEDYPGATISPPRGYLWGKYPQVPQVQETNTQYKQTAWLSDKQTNSLDMISNEIRALQISSIGKGSITPWFARGEIPEPQWWTEAASKLSPKYASAWEASKGGTVPRIVPDSIIGSTASIKPNSLLTGATAWATIYDDSGTCIGFNQPDQSANIHLTPFKKSFDAAAWAGIYDDKGTCVGHVPVTSDMNLGFIPGKGYEVGGSRVGGGGITSSEVPKLLTKIEDNTDESNKILATKLDILGMGIFETRGSLKSFPNVGGGGQSGALVTGLSKEGYIATYDPRTDTCEGFSFVAPDPSLKTTDPFYLGLTKNSPYRSEDKAPGYGWENVAHTDDQALQQLQKIEEQSYRDQQKAAKDTEQIEKHTKQLSMDMKASMSGKAYDSSGSLVALGGGGWGGGSGALNAYGTFGGSYGSAFGGWYTGGAAGLGASHGSGSPSYSWGAAASNAALSGGYSSGSFSAGSAIQYAEGGIVNDATYGVFGEAGREAFVPISDRAAGLRILPQVMRELGVRQFATGGFVGSSNITAAIGGSKIGEINVTVHNSRNLNEKQLAAEITKQVEKKFYQARKR